MEEDEEHLVSQRYIYLQEKEEEEEEEEEEEWEEGQSQKKRDTFTFKISTSPHWRRPLHGGTINTLVAECRSSAPLI